MKRTDDELAAALVRALQAEPRVADLDLGVHVADGVITLTGTVSSLGIKMAARDAVRDIVRQLGGGMELRNRLEFPIGAGARLTDVDLARAVRRVLERELPAPGRLHDPWRHVVVRCPGLAS